MSGFWRLNVTDEFSAGHALRHYQGKCENMHGHNFKVTATVEGRKTDPKTGMLLDFKIIKKGLKSVLDKLDHSILNELAPFDNINPSSENLACYIWQELQVFLSQYPDAKNCKLASIKVAEKNTQEAVYFAEISD